MTTENKPAGDVEVKRYYLDTTTGQKPRMVEDPLGFYCDSAHVTRLTAERDGLAAERLLLRDALDHIARTCGQSRTDTRRLRWIEYRANTALEGKPYDAKLLDLPINGDKRDLEQRRKIERLQFELSKALELLKAVHLGELFGPDGWETVNTYLNQYGLGGRCDSCDGTGDIVDIIGEWRGYCCCAAGIELKNRKPATPIAHNVDESCGQDAEAAKGE